MPNLRTIILIAFAFVSFQLWQTWQQDYAPVVPVQNNASSTSNTGETSYADTDTLTPEMPQMGDAPQLTATASAEQARPETQTIIVTTDVLKLEISTQGGSLVGAWLLDYAVSHDDATPVQLFNQNNVDFYVAQSGLIARGVKLPTHKSIFSVQQTEYNLADNADSVEVPMTWVDADNNQVVKTFTLKRGSYEVAVDQQVLTNTQATVARYLQFQRAPMPDAEESSFTNPGRAYSYFGAAMYSPEEMFQKQPFDEMADEPLNISLKGGWAAMTEHYFVSAWLPPADQNETYTTRVINKGSRERYMIQMVSDVKTAEIGQGVAFNDTIYIGPKLQKDIAEIVPGLELTVDYGIFTVISKPVFVVLSWLHDIVGNWGWSIVLVTLLIKLAFFKLSEAQYKSMARMRKLQPKMNALKERFASDKQQLNTAIMELYKKEKVNPLGGCLPILVQIPVFIALYWVLLESVELRQAPFILWLTDLSSPDPYFVLPVINGLAMLMTQKISPQVGTDPIQQKIMMAMPVVFSFMFAFFQSGLVLYWSVNSVLSLLQQWVITRRIEAQD